MTVPYCDTVFHSILFADYTTLHHITSHDWSHLFSFMHCFWEAANPRQSTWVFIVFIVIVESKRWAEKLRRSDALCQHQTPPRLRLKFIEFSHQTWPGIRYLPCSMYDVQMSSNIFEQMSSFWTGSIWHEDATGLDSLLPQTSHNLCLVLSRRCYSASKWSTVRPGKLSFSLQWDATCDATKAWFEHVTRSSRSRAVALFNAFEAKPIWIPQTRDNVKKVTKPCTESHFFFTAFFVGIVEFVPFFHFFPHQRTAGSQRGETGCGKCCMAQELRVSCDLEGSGVCGRCACRRDKTWWKYICWYSVKTAFCPKTDHPILRETAKHNCLKLQQFRVFVTILCW